MSDVARTARNPVVRGVAPDPSVCRVGDDFYMVTSSFDLWPGLPVRHSTDLVTWRTVGYAATRPAQVRRDGRPGFFSLFAATLRHHDGTFYLTCTTTASHSSSPVDGGDGNFLLTATDPAGPWSDAVWIDREAFDPSLCFEDDGSCHYTRRSFAVTDHGLELGPVVGAPIDPATGTLLADPVPLGPAGGGWCSDDAEGPHLYRIDGRYYLLAAEGGTGKGHMVTVARGDAAAGPFEPAPGNPVLSHRHLTTHPVQRTGHADLVEAPDGTWWALCLGVRQLPLTPAVLGRETFLLPVTWRDGWPELGVDGTVPLETPAPDLPATPPTAAWTAADPWLAGWSTRLFPVAGLVVRPADGTATLPAGPAPLDAEGPTGAAFLRQLEPEAGLHATVAELPAGARGGVTAYAHPQHHALLALEHGDTGPRLVAVRRARDLVTTETLPLPAGTGPADVELSVTCDGARYLLAARAGGAEVWRVAMDAALLDADLAPGFTSVRLGIAAVSTTGQDAGVVRFTGIGGTAVG